MIRHSEILRGRLPRLRLRSVSTALFLAAALAFAGPAAAGYIQIDGVADVKTRYSRGCETVEGIARLATQKGIDAVLFGDRARDSLEYGAWPLERIFKKTLSGPSLLASGALTYLSEINALNDRLEKTVLIPGAEVAPFYYWTGSSWQDDLVAHDADRRLWLLGLGTADDYEQLPLVGSNLTTRYADRFQNAALGYTFLFLAALALVLRNWRRRLSVPLAVLLFLLALNHHPFRSSPFDPHLGGQGLLPTQEVIDFVKKRGGMVFLSGMEYPPEPRKIGSVTVETAPYTGDLVQATSITGFQAVSPSPVQAVQAGREWDRALLDHIGGKRPAPVFGYGGNDFLCENMDGPMFGSVRTIFLVREKTREAILDAMAQGRMYAVRQPDDNRLSLDEFRVVEKELGHKAVMGETLLSTGAPEISLKVRATRGGEKTARLTLIRNGDIIREETVSLPYSMVYHDIEVPQEGTVYYRAQVSVSDVDYLVSNPIFVRFASGITETVKLAEQPGQPPRPPVPPAAPVTPPASGSESEAVAPEVAALETDTPGKPAAPAPPPEPAKPEAAPVETTPPPIPAKPEAAPVKTAPPPEPAKPPQRAGPPAAPAAGEAARHITIVADRATLRSGPGTIFPQVGQAQKGDRLRLVRRTGIEWNGGVWLMVDTGERRAYLWGGLARVE